jgi:hypothetical protein
VRSALSSEHRLRASLSKLPCVTSAVSECTTPESYPKLITRLFSTSFGKKSLGQVTWPFVQVETRSPRRPCTKTILIVVVSMCFIVMQGYPAALLHHCIRVFMPYCEPVFWHLDLCDNRYMCLKVAFRRWRGVVHFAITIYLCMVLQNKAGSLTEMR